jgi:hypothetical protein
MLNHFCNKNIFSVWHRWSVTLLNLIFHFSLYDNLNFLTKYKIQKDFVAIKRNAQNWMNLEVIKDVEKSQQIGNFDMLINLIYVDIFDKLS